MGKKSLFDPPDPPKTFGVGQYGKFKRADKRGRDPYLQGRGHSADYTGVAPRVGTGKKRTGMAKKPSSVSSGWKPAKVKRRK